MRLAPCAVFCLAVLLAGCAAGPSSSSSSTDGPIVVTRPDDYGNSTGDNASKPHLHDYWGGGDRLVVVDADGADPQPGLGGGEDTLIQAWRPDSGHVVPQGTAAVEVTFAWTPEDTDFYAAPTLWVKSAADSAARLVGPIEPGQTVAVPTSNNDNDLPHQLLSAWVVELHASSDPTLGSLRFKAIVHAKVEAVRGLEIPLYPGHPDRWNGANEVALLDETHSMAYLQDPGDGGCDGLSCSRVHVPANGTIVPPEAEVVIATLTVTNGVTGIALAYHGAEGRSFQVVEPDATEGNTRTYYIEVANNADGPYAQQSQWEFTTAITGPVQDGVTVEDYTLTVVVQRQG
ncbi:MAG: hypothetical protein QOD77_1068 [Thermoplasmata archaeon]|jgi:hypothetical protein|nr:hypothetical protein [Thermoplasmata archaeon]